MNTEPQFSTLFSWHNRAFVVSSLCRICDTSKLYMVAAGRTCLDGSGVCRLVWLVLPSPSRTSMTADNSCLVFDIQLVFLTIYMQCHHTYPARKKSETWQSSKREMLQRRWINGTWERVGLNSRDRLCVIHHQARGRFSIIKTLATW